ncbi:MAG: LPS assembly protein LptD [Gammaproteobacteria bacterium]|nr:LPS assembly protein LptD [Gammaproteobacteria bacterium]
MPTKKNTVRLPPFALSSLSLALWLAPVPALAAEGGDWFCSADAQGRWVCQDGAGAVAAPALAPAPAEPRTAHEAETPAPPRPAYEAEEAVAAPRQDAQTLPPAAIAAPGLVPKPAQTPAGLASCPSNFPPAEADALPAGDNKIHSTAPRVSTDKDGNVLMEGGAEIRQGERRIRADRAYLTKATEDVDASGEVSYRDPRLAAQGRALKGNLGTGAATLEDARYQLAGRNARGQAKRVGQTADRHVLMEDASFTTCPAGKDDWQFSAKEIDIDQDEGWGEARHMVLRAGDVPVFYFPYLTFPVDERRRSGFLWPDIGHSDRNGLDLSVPYYWNLAPNYDLTLNPRYMSERGLMLGTEFRHLSESTESQVAAEFLPNDQGESLADSENRYLYRVQNDSRLGGGFVAGLDVTDVSDDQYFHDLGTELSIANKEFLGRQGRVAWYGSHWNVSASASDTLALRTAVQPYEILPQVRARGQYDRIAGDLSFSFLSEATEFQHESQVDGRRVHVQPGFSYPLEWAAGFIRPSVKYLYTEYSQDLTHAPAGSPLEAGVTRELPLASLDSGLVFEREAGGGAVHTLEPRLFYLYAPAREQDGIQVFDSALLDSSYPQLFAENRFTGLDRIGDADQLTAALTSRWLAADGGELLRFSLGQIAYFADREVQLSPSINPATEDRSGLIAELAWQLSDSWRVAGAAEWDENESETQKAQAAVHYADQGYAFNLRHRLRRPDSNLPAGTGLLEQGDLSFALPLGASWSLVGRYNRDLVGDQDLETLGGIEYSSCCWALRLVGRRYLDVNLDSNGVQIPGGNDEYNQGIFVQFVFRGLATVGNNKAGSLLQRSIAGYEDRLSQ